MYQHISIDEAARQLMADENASWTSEAACSLAVYYDDLSQEVDCGSFNVVDIRCEWSEYSQEELVEQFGRRDSRFGRCWLLDGGLRDETIDDLIEAISEQTTLIKLENGNVLVVDF